VIAQSAVVYSQGANGMGKLDVSSGQISLILKVSWTLNVLCMELDSQFQDQLVSDILFYLALAFSKISATTTVGNMSPLSHKRILPIQIIIAGWALSAILVRAFACSLPSSWDYINGSCVDLVAFWAYVDVVNLVTDLLITGVTIEILVHLQMPLGTKAMVVGVFGSRIL
jgi:hypothetical protein